MGLGFCGCQLTPLPKARSLVQTYADRFFGTPLFDGIQRFARSFSTRDADTPTHNIICIYIYTHIIYTYIARGR